jgi:MFS family permease
VGRPAAGALRFYGSRIVAVAFLVDFIAVGFFFYSFGIYYPAIDADFPGGSVWVAAGLSVSNAVSGFFAPFVGRALDRFPIRRIMLLGAVVVSAGFGLLSLTTTLWQYYLVLGTFFSFGLGMMGGLASTKLVANWYVARRGTALGIATMGVSLSGLVMPHVANWLVSELGWRGGFQVYALGILVVVVPAVAWVVVTRPEDIGQRTDGDDDAMAADPNGPPERVWSTGEILRSAHFWLIALPFALTFSALSAILIHIVPYAADLGIDSSRAALVLSVAAGGGVVGKLAFGRLVDRFDPRVAVLASFGTQVVGLVAIMNAGEYAALLAGSVLFGFGMGGVVPLQGALAGAAFGRLSFGEVMGLMRPVQVPLHAVGIPLAAMIHDFTGSFQPAWWIFLGVYAASGLIIAGLRLPRPPKPAPLSGDEPGLV